MRLSRTAPRSAARGQAAEGLAHRQRHDGRGGKAKQAKGRLTVKAPKRKRRRPSPACLGY